MSEREVKAEVEAVVRRVYPTNRRDAEIEGNAGKPFLFTYQPCSGDTHCATCYDTRIRGILAEQRVQLRPSRLVVTEPYRRRTICCDSNRGNDRKYFGGRMWPRDSWIGYQNTSQEYI